MKSCRQMAYNTEFKGVRLIPARGNVGQNLSWTLRGINVQPGDTLYWGVQTINRAFTPSRFVESELVFINVSSEAVGESINDVHLHTFPNPSRGHPTIQFSLDSAGWVQVRVYDMLGREVMSLVDAFYTAGSHNRDSRTRSIGSRNIFLCTYNRREYVFNYKCSVLGFNCVQPRFEDSFSVASNKQCRFSPEPFLRPGYYWFSIGGQV